MRKGKVRYAILSALESAIKGVDWEVFLRPGNSVFYGDPLPKSNLSLNLSRLFKAGLIEKSINEGKIILKLTDAGRDWVLRYKDYDGRDWDGVWRLVIFDIPEKHRLVRGTLRRRLKEWGFAPWQKSVWASKKPLTGHLRNLVKDLDIEEWVLVVESGDVGKLHLVGRSDK